MQKYEKKYIFRHMKVQKKEKNGDTWRSQGIEKNDEHMKAHIKMKKWMMIAMSQK
jgi:hypothetical protein